MKNKNIFVYGHWGAMKSEMLIGTLKAELVRGKEIFSFEYAKEWLSSGFSGILDPDLIWLPGAQYLNNDKPNFGMFLDSSPDRWGRVLMKRREAIIARQESRKPDILLESDFLLGVYDQTRMGGLRFKLAEDGNFLSYDSKFAAPPWTSLRELENASLKLERDDIGMNEELKWLNMLMAPGSSLGGARPKASVIDPNGCLYIAKFPSINDERDMGAWEMVVHELAEKSGLSVSSAMVAKYSGKHHTFLTKRFDRAGGKRIHFASAMTLLGYIDGADHIEGRSYLDIANYIVKGTDGVQANLTELWKRVLFNVLVKNTDDHLRNHGFLMGNKGWSLSPAYDMNANPYGMGLTLNISEDDNSLDPELVMEMAPKFRLRHQEAQEYLAQMKKTVSLWPTLAKKYGISRSEQYMMEPAFYFEPDRNLNVGRDNSLGL